MTEVFCPDCRFKQPSEQPETEARDLSAFIAEGMTRLESETPGTNGPHIARGI